MDPAERALQPAQSDPHSLQVYIIAPELSDFRDAKAMTVGDQKEGLIALSLDDGHKPAQLIEGEELDLLDAFGGAPPSLRDFGGPGGLLRFSRLPFFLGFAFFIAYN